MKKTSAVAVLTAGVLCVSGCGSAAETASPAPPSPGATTAAATSKASTAAASGTMFGDPVAAAKYWQQQSLEDNCGLLAVADVVGELTGHAPTERQMIALAVSLPSSTNPGPIYAPVDDPSHANGTGGIEMADEVVLLEHYGIKSTMVDASQAGQTGLPALERYLTDNRKIIAWVNSAIIWNTSDQRATADHFLVVTGIDADNGIVHVNDSGAERADEQIAIGTFTSAWQPGGDSIVVTAAAA